MGGDSQRDSALLDFVERMGGSFESVGLTRLAGRMLGWLLICDPPHQSSDQLAVALRASSGGVSTTARQLIQYGFVERFGVPSDRRAFFRLRRHAFEASFAQSIESASTMHRLALAGLDALGGQDANRRDVWRKCVSSTPSCNASSQR